ncbi:hypothetical protein CONPUDRAFT_143323 [Coniophora puteana RWD-64-598 SS2]|uniref:Uncharacterized protein n=1 Tax=Coniophora puteana (strain RWD-64-598) TaxID=741705 RepID=A0A5M3MW95_CONPW|nr:uncharacterized protein CONPUDRAFT_143323 [Coniophora puteana RWD-64-598 SS2]EIW83419.1 hypothetical protein CONPUDRAFT_143323 [Coniophora puteana RWD-64-598 SS2]
MPPIQTDMPASAIASSRVVGSRERPRTHESEIPEDRELEYELRYRRTQQESDDAKRAVAQAQSDEATRAVAKSIKDLTATAHSISRDYMDLARCVPPQVIVRRRGGQERHAWGRSWLRDTGYNNSTYAFIKRLAQREDYTPATFMGCTFLARPLVRVSATFHPRCLHGTGQIQPPPPIPGVPIPIPPVHDYVEVPPADARLLDEPVVIGEEGWSSLLGTVAVLEVEFTRRQFLPPTSTWRAIGDFFVRFGLYMSYVFS